MWLITKKKEGDRLIVSLIIKRRPFKFTLLEIINEIQTRKEFRKTKREFAQYKEEVRRSRSLK